MFGKHCVLLIQAKSKVLMKLSRNSSIMCNFPLCSTPPPFPANSTILYSGSGRSIPLSQYKILVIDYLLTDTDHSLFFAPLPRFSSLFCTAKPLNLSPKKFRLVNWISCQEILSTAVACPNVLCTPRNKWQIPSGYHIHGFSESFR